MNLTWHWPQIFYVVVLLWALTIAAVKNGEPLTILKYNFAASFMRAIIWLIVLYFGGFFTSP